MNSRSIHIGLNRLDDARYAGFHGMLHASIADAEAMARIAKRQGIANQLILPDEHATHDAVIDAFRAAASDLDRGDYLLVTFSGHGASYRNIPLPGDPPEWNDWEVDGNDEAWCLFDTYLLDDEIHAELCKFRSGVRVLVVSDSCYSGTVTRGEFQLVLPPRMDGLAPGLERRIDPAFAQGLFEVNYLETYRPRLITAAPARPMSGGAHVLLFSACRDNQTAIEGDHGHGRFTEVLLDIWADGAFEGSHRAFIDAIAARLCPDQCPGLYPTGAPSAAFIQSRPFTP